MRARHRLPMLLRTPLGVFLAGAALAIAGRTSIPARARRHCIFAVRRSAFVDDGEKHRRMPRDRFEQKKERGLETAVQKAHLNQIEVSQTLYAREPSSMLHRELK